MSQLEVWETAVRERPAQARIFGPPNWLVCERVAADASPEVRAEAVEALRREYGLDVPTSELSLHNVPTPLSTCLTCGVRPREGRYKECSACRKAAQRGKA